jgi:hypothetical protein
MDDEPSPRVFTRLITSASDLDSDRVKLNPSTTIGRSIRYCIHSTPNTLSVNRTVSIGWLFDTMVGEFQAKCSLMVRVVYYRVPQNEKCP